MKTHLPCQKALLAIGLAIFSSSSQSDELVNPSPDPTCSQYFKAGYIYEGKGKTLSNILRNTGNTELHILKSEQVSPSIGILFPGIISFTTPEFQYAKELFSECEGTWCTNGTSNSSYAKLKPQNNAKWIETSSDKHLGVVSVKKNLVTIENREKIRDGFFLVRYESKGKFFSTRSKKYVQNFNNTACQAIGVHFCGDGLVENVIEQCDPEDSNRFGWGKNGCSSKCESQQ